MDEESLTTRINYTSMPQYQEDFPNITFSLAFHTAFSDLFYRHMFIIFYSIIFIVCIVGKYTAFVSLTETCVVCCVG